jgi:beta-phosphoglucomutase
MVRAVIFDFNGVLIDDESVHCDLFREVLAREGVVMTEHDYHERYLGLDDRGCFEAALRDAGQAAGRERVDGMIATKARRYLEVAGEGLRLFPHAPECLTELAERFALAINSGALRPEIELALDRMERRDRVVAIVSAEEAERCKPDPQGYSLALEKLRAVEGLGMADLLPSECLVIEDSLAGIESAKGAGMWAVGIPNTYTAEDLRQAGADAVVISLTGFTPEWIASRFGAPAAKR